ncbi:MAG: hypothetical protein NTU45_16155 [Planctomycetota bacterium]|nr:hypothetical protein [Planctomycetota bacterium]
MIGEIPWHVLLACCVAQTAIAFHGPDESRPTDFRRNWTLDCRGWSRRLGSFALIATAAHFGFTTQWYWALLLVALTHFLAVLAALPYAVLVGRSRALPAAYLVWPLCVIWANIAIHSLAQAQSTR